MEIYRDAVTGYKVRTGFAGKLKGGLPVLFLAKKGGMTDNKGRTGNKPGGGKGEIPE